MVSKSAPIFETLGIEEPEPGLLVVTLNRPEARNALNTQMGRDLRAFFQPLAFTPGELRCIVLTGSGDKAFCAGGDLKERDGMSDHAWRLQHAIFEEAIYAIQDSAVPVVAAVNGAAFGGGFEIALASDFIYASEGARFALTEVTLGIMPGAGGTQNLPRAVGSRRAKEVLLTGLPFSASDGFDWGLINRVCAPDELLTDALGVARRSRDNAPISIRQAKKAIDIGTQLDIRSARIFEVQAYERMISTEDRHEGVSAWAERRKAEFKGR
jgi:enoyl-CoA hydratase/carnithine racemase